MRRKQTIDNLAALQQEGSRYDRSAIMYERALAQNRKFSFPGAGDMLKSAYDPDDDGIVARADQVNFPLYTTGTRPAAGSTWRGKHIIVEGAGADDEEQVCLRNSAGGYVWVTVAVAG